jgi:hypothetical protein
VSDIKVTLDRSKYDYTAHKDYKTPSGRTAVDNADAVAEVLRGMTLEGVLETLVANGGTVNPKWAHLNPGMQRMAAGNVLRRIAKALPEGKSLKIPVAAKQTIGKVDTVAVEKAKLAAKAAAEKAKAEKAKLAAKAAAEKEKAKAKTDKKAA